VPLSGILLLFLYAVFALAPAIEAQTESRVADALADYEDVNVEAGGQGVRVTATAPASAKKSIQALAQSAACTTWAGELICPTNVAVQLREPVEPQPAVASRFHDFEFQRTADGIVLRGEVPSDAARRDLLASARADFDNVTDELRVSGETASEHFDAATSRAIATLARLESGVASWANGVFSLRGVVTAANESLARNAFRATALAPPLGDLDLRVADDASRCNENFAAALAGATIRFQTASAVIDAGSEALLARLAAIAGNCPGRLVIEGHTDSVGNAASNQALSLDRAEAVRDALGALGLDTTRLDAIGFGEDRPIADNATPAGRASNRRIVIRVAESG
jgi:outer membrane protein OmpA-like peptidoglycan-associated protein